MVSYASCIVRSVAAPDHRRMLQRPGVDAKANTSAHAGWTHLVNVCARRSDPERRSRILAPSGHDNGPAYLNQSDCGLGHLPLSK